jgi:hypothetical protein
MKSRRSRSPGGPAIAAFALVLSIGSWSVPAAAQGDYVVEPDRSERGNCGTVDLSRQPPRAYLSVVIDGVPRHFVATWGGVEELRQQPDSYPPVFVHQATIFAATGATQYSCADLVAYDVNHDGHLDLVYASHRELVVLENQGGRFVATRRQPVDLPFDAYLRIEVSAEALRVVR